MGISHIQIETHSSAGNLANTGIQYNEDFGSLLQEKSDRNQCPDTIKGGRANAGDIHDVLDLLERAIL